jgi:hypothetical protein
MLSRHSRTRAPHLVTHLVFADDDVLGAYITMDDAAGMDGLQGLQAGRDSLMGVQEA